MIRCSHCGKLAPAGATSCQGCGMPLVNATGDARMAGAGQSDQSELPAWLESLRSHERPVPSSAGAQPFSSDELVDENAMPSWMRQDQSRLAESGNSDAFPALPYTARPGGGREGQVPGTNVLEASSLIDEQSLPSWIRGGQENIQPVSGVSGAGLSANSLVQRDGLPDWMRNLGPEAQQQAPQQQYGLSMQPPPTPAPPEALMRMPQTPPIVPAYNEIAQPPAQGFMAGDLIDHQALPDWMKGGQEQPGPTRPVPQGHGFSAGDLIDQQSVPKWLQEQGRGVSGPVSAMGVPVNGSGQKTGMGQDIPGGEGIPASMLLDRNALPTWIQEGAANATPGSETPQPERMAAGSLIDPNALPTWLRNTDNSQPGAGNRQLGQNRFDGVRVPSRPRVDSGPKDQSEVAANVFASMLGVAAATPSLASQALPPANGFEAMPMQQAQPGASNWQAPLQQTANQNAQPQAWQNAGSMPPIENQPWLNAGSMPPAENQAWQPSGSLSQPEYRTGTPDFNAPPLGGQPGDMSNMQMNASQRPQSGYGYNGYMGVSEGNRAEAGSSFSGSGGSANRANPAERAKKKGVFESIRDFFFK